MREIFGFVCFEVMIFPLYLLNIDMKSLILAAIGLHLSVFLVMGISFWHLWMLYPIVFSPVLFPAWHKKHLSSPVLSEQGLEVNS